MSGIVAIFGLPGVGKSTVADVLAIRTGANVRHCGDLVKARAKQLGVSLDSLPVEEHRAIDGETREVAIAAAEPLIIEGRFLDSVLHDVSSVVHVNLTCSFDERVRRDEGRGGCRERLQEQDAWTEEFRTSMYGVAPATRSNVITIDTDGLSPAAVAALVEAQTSSR